MFRHSDAVDAQEDALQGYLDARGEAHECHRCGTVLYRTFDGDSLSWRPVAPAEFYVMDAACGECRKFLAEWEANLRPGAPGRVAPEVVPNAQAPNAGIRIGGLNDA